jgi:transposase InsO family protein
VKAVAAFIISRSGNVWDNVAMERFFSSMKTERIARKVYRTRNQARADVFEYIERFDNPRRRHSTIGYLSPMNSNEWQIRLKDSIHQTGSNSFACDLPTGPT